MRLGIDAVNIRGGGGVTHLVELLSACDPRQFGISQITVWACGNTSKQLPDRPWINAVHPPALDGGLMDRELWRRRKLPAEVREKCDLLFVPGSTYIGDFTPYVTMSQNLLPFEDPERQRYGLSLTRLRLEILKRSQSKTFSRAQGVIFLTDTAQDVVTQYTGPLQGQTAVVPHGVSSRFMRSANPGDTAFSPTNPFKWLYVSTVNLYKHQWHVAEAAGRLRAAGYPVELHLVGGGYPPAVHRLRQTMARVNATEPVVHYHGLIPYSTIDALYRDAHGVVFASTCENMPNILIESMAAGLPIACSDKPVMREVLGDAGLYFNAENVEDIYSAMKRYMDDRLLRQSHADAAMALSRKFTWDHCAQATFQFLVQVYDEHVRTRTA